MSIGFYLKKREDVSRLDVINAIVSAVPDVTFVNIEDPFMLLGIRDKSLRGVVVQENDGEWDVMVPSSASMADYTLFQSVLRTMSDDLGLPILVQEALVDSDFGFGDEPDDEFEDDYEESEDFNSGDEDDFDEEEYDFDEDDYEDDYDDEKADFPDGPLVETAYSNIEPHFFYPGWEKDVVCRELGMIRALVCFSGTSAISQGLFHSFCIGPWLLTRFGISVEPDFHGYPASGAEIRNFADMLRQASPELADSVFPESVSFLSDRIVSITLSDEEAEKALDLMSHLSQVQWQYSGCPDTSTEMRAVNPEFHPEIIRGEFNRDDDEDPATFSKSISALSSRRLMEGEFPLFISYADLASVTHDGIEDPDNTLLIPFDSLPSIMSGKRVDDLQFVIEHPMKEGEVDNFLGAVPVFVPRDIFFTPDWPGFGHSDRQNTYIMMWNPEISSIKMEDFRDILAHMRTASLNWSIHERGDARIGDRFYLVCCGGSHRGMVASGLLASNPYMGEDWSGKGREVWYVDLAFNVMVDPEEGNPVSLDELTLAMPDFDWHGGHSGRLLPKAQSEVLNDLWRGHLLPWIDELGHKDSAGQPKVNIIFR